MGRLAFPSLFMGMDILTKEGRIPSELVPLAIAWGQGVAAEIEALFCPEEREEPPRKVALPKCDGLRSGSVLTVARYPQP